MTTTATRDNKAIKNAIIFPFRSSGLKKQTKEDIKRTSCPITPLITNASANTPHNISSSIPPKNVVVCIIVNDCINPQTDNTANAIYRIFKIE